jgi:hypothetical protein
MLGASTIINPIIKIVTTVVILGAVYLFFVKPALDTTENITNSISESIPESFGSFEDLSQGLSGGDQDKLRRCIERASSDTTKVQRCVDRFVN